MADPRIGLASVTAVLMAQDARSARIMVTVAGDEAEAERTLEGLAAAKNYVRHELAERLRLRKPPELYFQIDRADQLESRVDELLGGREETPTEECGAQPVKVVAQFSVLSVPSYFSKSRLRTESRKPERASEQS